MSMRYWREPRHANEVPIFIGDARLDRKISAALNWLGINYNTTFADRSICNRTFKVFEANYESHEARALSFLAATIFCSEGAYGEDFPRAINLAEQHLLTR